MKEYRFSLASAYEQLAAMVDKGETASAADPETAAHLEVVRLLTADAASPADMPRSVEFRRQVLERLRRRPGRYRFFYLAAAAAILLGLFVRGPWQQQVDAKILIDGPALARSEEKHLQNDMVAYLENTERLLVFMRDNELSCSEETRDIAPEKELAKALLYQQQHFAPEMTQPQFVQARELFSQLEHILVDVNNLDACTDPDEIDFINTQISKKRILSKLRLIAQDIRLS